MTDVLLPRVLADLSAEHVGTRCLVTGARGFIGRRLVDALAVLGCSVVAADIARIPQGQTPGVTHKKVDVCKRRAVDELLAFHPVDTVFHCAGSMSVQGMSPPTIERALMQVNVVGTATMLAAARRAGAKRFVFVSTHQVALGGAGNALDESVPMARAPLDAYTRSKQYAERAVLEADGVGGMRTLALRPAGVWGAGGMMITAFLAQLIAGRFARWIGCRNDVFDTTHLDSLVRALLLGAARLCDAPQVAGGQTYFITDDERYGPMEWFAPLVTGLGYPLPRRRLRARWLWPVAWSMEVVHRLGGAPAALTRPVLTKLSGMIHHSVDKARVELGWAPVVSRDEGVQLLASDLHRIHAEIRAVQAAKQLPFRAPDFALFHDPVPKFVFVVWDRAAPDPARRRSRLVDQVGTALRTHLAVVTLSVDVDGPNSRVRSPSPFPLGARPVAGLVNLRTPTTDAPARVHRILSEHGFDAAGYRVESSIYRDYGDNAHAPPRDWADGVASPGVVAVTLFEKPSRMAYDDWLSAWHHGISPLSEAIQPRTRYVRNRVLEPVTVGAPPVAGIVEECFPSADHVRDPRKFYGADSIPSLVKNMARILWSVTRFLNIFRIQTTVMTETILVSTSHVDGRQTGEPRATGREHLARLPGQNG